MFHRASLSLTLFKRKVHSLSRQVSLRWNSFSTSSCWLLFNIFKLHTSYTSNAQIQFTFSPCWPEPVMLCSASPATTLLSPLTRLPPKLVECLMFLQVAWLESTDYLFLRNNIPDFSRLKGGALFRTSQTSSGPPAVKIDSGPPNRNLWSKVSFHQVLLILK